MKNIIEIKTNYADRYVMNYILPSKDYCILIDSGIVSSWDEVYQKINAESQSNKNVQFIVINTHEHWDHIGLNAMLMKEKKALIMAHKAGKEWIEDHKYQYQKSFKAFYPEYIPDSKTGQMYWKEIGRPSKVALFLKDGELIETSEYELEVIHTPGHSPGSICLFEKQKGFLFSGDTVQGNGFFGKLPLYTNVLHYLNSLKELKNISPSFIFGGHTPTIEGEKNVKHILDLGIKTIGDIEEATRNTLNKISSNKKLSDIVKQVCKELGAKFSIHAFFSVLAHINNMKDDVPVAVDIVDEYVKQKNLMSYL